MTTVLLHGFWGQPSDWNAVLNRLPLGMPVLIPYLYSPGPLAPTTMYGDWPARFWHWVEHESAEGPLQIVGYSMGARLALSAILCAPTRVKRALLISGRPLLVDSEHGAREKWEQDFAEDFRRLDWPTLEAKWQEQSVFAGAPAMPRRHSESLREMLALSLLNWSPRRHGFGASEVRAVGSHVQWAFGALDQNYLGVAKDLQELPVRGQISILPNVGHRVIQEAPEFVTNWIKE